MALEDHTPESAGRRPPRPSSRVGDESFNIAMAFEVLTDEIRAMNQTLIALRKDTKKNADVMSRFGRVGSRRSSRSSSAAPDHPSESFDPLAGIINTINETLFSRRRSRGDDEEPPSTTQSLLRLIQNIQRGSRPGLHSLTHLQTLATDLIDKKGSATAGYTTVKTLPFQNLWIGTHPGGKGTEVYEPLGTQILPANMEIQAGEKGPMLYDKAGTKVVPQAPPPSSLGTGALSVAARAIPGVGLAIASVGLGREFYLSQRERAREYQEITGTTGWEGWVDKLSEDVYRWGNFFTFSGDRAREQYRVATAAGYNDVADTGLYRGSRTQALNFLDRAYHDYGMDASEAAPFLEVAQRASTDLDRLTQTIHRLSEAAGEAGFNAMSARESFLSMFDAMNRRGYNSAALPSAEIMTSAQLSYGRNFENVDFTGLTNINTMAYVAGQTGMGLGEVQTMLDQSPGEYFMAASASFLNALRMVSPDVYNAVESAVQGQDVSSAQVRQRIMQELKRGPLSGMDLETIAQAVSSLVGIPLNRDQMLEMAITELGGAGMGQAAIEQQQRQEGARPGAVGEVASRGGSALSQDALEKTYYGADPFLGLGGTKMSELTPEEQQRILEQGREEVQENRFAMSDEARAYRDYMAQLRRGSLAADGSFANEVGHAYWKYVDETGRQDPFTETLIKNLGDQSSNALVEIETKDGTQVMPLADAIQNFPDAVSSGQLRFVNEELAGRTLEDVAGIQGTGSYSPIGRTSEELAQEGIGMPGEEWRQENPLSSEGAQGSRHVIELSPNAQRLFTLLEVDPNTPAGMGVPPDPGSSYLNRNPSGYEGY